MSNDLVRRHVGQMLAEIQAKCKDVTSSAQAGTAFPLIGHQDVEVAIDELRQIGLTVAANSLSERFRKLRDALLEHGFTAMVADGVDAESLREKFGHFPLPNPDPSIHIEMQNYRGQSVAGSYASLGEFVETIIALLNDRTAAARPIGKERPVTIQKGQLRLALGISEREMTQRLSSGEIKHSSSGTRAKKIRVDVMQFDTRVQQKIMSSLGLDSSVDATP